MRWYQGWGGVSQPIVICPNSVRNEVCSFVANFCDVVIHCFRCTDCFVTIGAEDGDVVAGFRNVNIRDSVAFFHCFFYIICQAVGDVGIRVRIVPSYINDVSVFWLLLGRKG